MSNKLYTLERVQEGACEFSQPVHMWFVNLEKAYDHVPRGTLLEELREYAVRQSLAMGHSTAELLD